jgi:hypothetical protein
MLKRTRPLVATIAAAGAVGALAAPATAADADSGVHKTPRLPVVIDGVRYAPQAIHRYDGQDVHLRLRRAANGKAELVVSSKRPKLVHTRKAGASSPGGHVVFAEHANGAGARFWRGHSESVSRLSTVPTGCFIFCWGSFDNIISSVETNGAHTVLFDGINFTGSSLSIPEEWGRRANLTDWGFNDRASSLWVD